MAVVGGVGCWVGVLVCEPPWLRRVVFRHRGLSYGTSPGLPPVPYVLRSVFVTGAFPGSTPGCRPCRFSLGRAHRGRNRLNPGLLSRLAFLGNRRDGEVALGVAVAAFFHGMVNACAYLDLVSACYAGMIFRIFNS